MSEKMSFPFFGILALIFITLKLTGYIAWAWLWVLAPLWIPLCVTLACMLIGLLCVVTFANNRRKNFR